MELTTVLRHQLATLRRKWRDLLVLCDVQEVNVAQAAQQLGISLADARSSLYRARFRLRERLSSSFDGAQKLQKQGFC